MLSPADPELQLLTARAGDSLSRAQPGRCSNTPLYSALPKHKDVLRVAVMLDQTTLPRWATEVLMQIEQLEIAKVSAVILCPNPTTRGNGQAGFSAILWRFYQKLDETRHPLLLAPFRPIPLREILGDVPTLTIKPLDTHDGQQFSDADLDKVKAESLDVILHFGSVHLQGKILTASRYGIWTYQHGDVDCYRGGPAGFWEMYECNPITGATLEIINDKPDGGRTIYRSFSATESFESLVKNRAMHVRKSIPFVARCLRILYEHGQDGLAVQSISAAPPKLPRLLPNNAQMVRFLGRTLLRSISSRLAQHLDRVDDHWFLAYVLGRETQPGNGTPVFALHPPDGHFWADPCVVKSKGEHYVFFEDYDYARGIGNISAFWIGLDGSRGVPQTVLSTGSHLSYPFVFEWQGVRYMIPESSSERMVKLYREQNFPYQWRLESILLNNIAAVDTTLFEHDDHWYLFANVSESGGSKWDELFLFVADTPLGPWLPHPMNPIVSNVEAARPAGAIFRHNGKLYRPAQNCAPSYGASIEVQEVLALSPRDYRERPAYKIEPTWLPNIRGCHTISLSNEITLLDCKMPKRQPARRRQVTHSAKHRFWMPQWSVWRD
jgi:hypothetical protein